MGVCPLKTPCELLYLSERVLTSGLKEEVSLVRENWDAEGDIYRPAFIFPEIPSFPPYLGLADPPLTAIERHLAL